MRRFLVSRCGVRVGVKPPTRLRHCGVGGVGGRLATLQPRRAQQPQQQQPQQQPQQQRHIQSQASESSASSPAPAAAMGPQRQTPQLWDSVRRCVRPVTPTGPNGCLTWYTCGPTVYDAAHMGHARTYVALDVVQRVLRWAGVHTWHVMGVTDVDDKLVQRSAASEGAQEPPAACSSAWMQRMHALSRAQEAAFVRDLARLGCEPPAAWCRVTQWIPELRSFVQRLLDQGMAYVDPRDGGSVYFDTAAFEARGHTYGKLSPYGVGRNAVLAQAAGDGTGEQPQDVPGKACAADFALWKAVDAKEPGWESPWCAHGRPGWHLECSTMITHMFGNKVDVHAGGVDLKFPHHTNEIAQCEAVHGSHEDWAHTFVHTGHLHIEGQKMSKSLKNFTTIDTFLQQHSADHFRLFCLSTRYRANVDWSEDRMTEAEQQLRTIGELRFAIASLKQRAQGHDEDADLRYHVKRWTSVEHELMTRFTSTQTTVRDALLSDVNTPQALKALMSLVATSHAYVSPRSARDVSIELLHNIWSYCSHMFTMFGLHSDAVQPLTGALAHVPTTGAHAGTNGGRDTDAHDVMTAFVRFRSSVRQLAVQHKGNKSGVVSDLWKLCDDLRDNGFRKLGVKVDDRLDASTWRWSSDDDEVKQ